MHCSVWIFPNMSSEQSKHVLSFPPADQFVVKYGAFSWLAARNLGQLRLPLNDSGHLEWCSANVQQRCSCSGGHRSCSRSINTCCSGGCAVVFSGVQCCAAVCSGVQWRLEIHQYVLLSCAAISCNLPLASFLNAREVHKKDCKDTILI